MSIQIAIDGPAGAGKSTIAKILAKEKNFIYLDTGAMYRGFGLYAIRKGVSFEGWDETNADERLGGILDDFTMNIEYRDGSQHVVVNGEDVTDMIRTPEVSLAASKVAVVPAVRLKLVELQRKIAADNNVVMDGRDIGSYVLPGATVKIFLTASAEARAQRRYIELQEKGQTDVTYEEVLEDMKFRDKNDSSRKFAPLTCAEDAIKVDTTECTLEESINRIKEVVESKLC
ncbi:MAG: (d)CMP kinase [Ruminococcaceae bacterium]|nr:(d)CMP kinase [Oscillospiraceae bacterium]